MSGVEGFSGFDSGGEISEEALEAYKERMRGATRDLQAWKKSEQKSKKKEDELLKILMQYIKRNQKSSFVLLISRLLEQNVPAGFILGMILLGDAEIQHELGINLQLPSGPDHQQEQRPSNGAAESMLVMFGAEDKTLPLKARIEFDFWYKNMFEQASVRPYKLISTLEDKNENNEPNGQAKLVAVQLFGFVMREFLDKYGIEAEFEHIRNFSSLTLASILQQIHQIVDNQGLLGDHH